MTYVSAVMVENGITLVSDGRMMKGERIVSDCVQKFANNNKLVIAWAGTINDTVIEVIKNYLKKNELERNYDALINYLYIHSENASYMICDLVSMEITIINDSFENKCNRIEFEKRGSKEEYIIASVGGDGNEAKNQKTTRKIHENFNFSSDNLEGNLGEQTKFMKQLIESDEMHTVGGEMYTCILEKN